MNPPSSFFVSAFIIGLSVSGTDEDPELADEVEDDPEVDEEVDVLAEPLLVDELDPSLVVEELEPLSVEVEEIGTFAQLVWIHPTLIRPD